MNLPARVKMLETRANPSEPEGVTITVLRFGEDSPQREPIYTVTTDGRPLTVEYHLVARSIGSR